MSFTASGPFDTLDGRFRFDFHLSLLPVAPRNPQVSAPQFEALLPWKVQGVLHEGESAGSGCGRKRKPFRGTGAYAGSVLRSLKNTGCVFDSTWYTHTEAKATTNVNFFLSPPCSRICMYVCMYTKFTYNKWSVVILIVCGWGGGQEYNQKTRALGAAGRGSKPGRKPAAAAASTGDGSSSTSPRPGSEPGDTENVIVTRCVQ